MRTLPGPTSGNRARRQRASIRRSHIELLARQLIRATRLCFFGIFFLFCFDQTSNIMLMLPHSCINCFSIKVPSIFLNVCLINAQAALSTLPNQWQQQREQQQLEINKYRVLRPTQLTPGYAWLRCILVPECDAVARLRPCPSLVFVLLRFGIFLSHFTS